MNDEQIVKYVKEIIISNLSNYHIKDAILVATDETNELLLEHINGLIKLFEKAKEILEKKGIKDEPK